MVNNIILIELFINLFAYLLAIMLFILLLKNKKYKSVEHDNSKGRKKKMDKKRIKIAKKNRKSLVKRIKNMTPEQFDAYYETLVEIYGRECFHKEFAKRYVRRLKGVSEEIVKDEKDLAVAKKKSNR